MKLLTKREQQAITVLNVPNPVPAYAFGRVMFPHIPALNTNEIAQSVADLMNPLLALYYVECFQGNVSDDSYFRSTAEGLKAADHSVMGICWQHSTAHINAENTINGGHVDGDVVLRSGKVGELQIKFNLPSVRENNLKADLQEGILRVYGLYEFYHKPKLLTTSTLFSADVILPPSINPDSLRVRCWDGKMYVQFMDF